MRLPASHQLTMQAHAGGRAGQLIISLYIKSQYEEIMHYM